MSLSHSSFCFTMYVCMCVEAALERFICWRDFDHCFFTANTLLCGTDTARYSVIYLKAIVRCQRKALVGMNISLDGLNVKIWGFI